MAHRGSPCGSTDLDVVMSYSGLGLVRGRAKDITAEGMSVNAGVVVLPLHAVLEVSFYLGEETREAMHRVDAVVDQHTNDGVRLAFKDSEGDGQERLVAWIAEFAHAEDTAQRLGAGQ